MRRMQVVTAAAAAIFGATLAGGAQAAVTVFGGGMAEQCSKAALAGETDRRFEELCTQSLETELLAPRDKAGTFINRGVMKLRRLEWDGATRDFDAAIRLKGDMGEAYVNRGAASIGKKRYAESLKDLNRGIELGVEEPAKAYYNRALAYEGVDDMKSAYFDYQKALELHPDWELPKRELARFTVSHR